VFQPKDTKASEFHHENHSQLEWNDLSRLHFYKEFSTLNYSIWWIICFLMIF
jgi:hypothetical protein